MDYDRVLDEYVGQFGLWQKLVFGLAGLTAGGSAFMTMMSAFTQFTPDRFRCFVPECEDGGGILFNVTSAIPDEDSELRKCFRYQWMNITSDGNNCHPDNFNKSADLKVCYDHVYDTEPTGTNYGVSIVTDFDLAPCDDGWPFSPLISKSAFIGMAYMFGVLVGSVINGILSDRIGRKKTLLIAILATFGSSLGGAFVTSYWPYLVLRLLTGCFAVGLFIVAFTISVEICGVDYKSALGIFIQIPFALAEMVLGLVAFFIREWNRLQIVLSCSIAGIGIICLLMPESPRWLMSQHKYIEAKQILNRGAGINGRALPEDLLHYEHDRSNERNERCNIIDEKLGFTSMFNSWYVAKISTVIFVNWLVTCMCYYGLSMSSVNLSGNIYVNFILSAVIEIPSYLFTFFVIDHIGRKTLLVFSNFLAGSACIGAAFLDPDQTAGIISLSLFGKFGASASFAVVYLYTAELYPTAIRNTALGTASMMARIGGIVAPLLAGIKGETPLIIMGGSSLVGGVLTLLLPETLGLKLPETLEDIKNLSKNSKPFWKWISKSELIALRQFSVSRIPDRQIFGMIDEDEGKFRIPTIVVEDVTTNEIYKY